MLHRVAWQLGFWVALLAFPCLVRAQKPSAIPLVPAANWRMASSNTLDLEAVREWGGDPVIEREYGVKTLEHRTYLLDGRGLEVIVEQTPDPSAAYGLLTYYQTETMAPAKGMQLTLIGPEGALMGRGRYFIRVPRPAGAQVSDNDFQALLIFMGGTRPSAREMAQLPPALPAKGLVPASAKYLLGLEAARRVLPSFRTDLIGFLQGAEVHMGAYKSGELRLTLLAINYPTPQIARVRLAAMEKLLGLNEDRGAASIYGKRSGSYVFLVLGSPSPAPATSLMDQFQVTGHISWDEPYPRAKPFAVELLELIIANLLLIMIVAGSGVVGGVLVFAMRRAAAKWFPQWTWADPDHETIIRLNLS